MEVNTIIHSIHWTWIEFDGYRVICNKRCMQFTFWLCFHIGKVIYLRLHMKCRSVEVVVDILDFYSKSFRRDEKTQIIHRNEKGKEGGEKRIFFELNFENILFSVLRGFFSNCAKQTKRGGKTFLFQYRLNYPRIELKWNQKLNDMVYI